MTQNVTRNLYDSIHLYLSSMLLEHDCVTLQLTVNLFFIIPEIIIIRREINHTIPNDCRNVFVNNTRCACRELNPGQKLGKLL